MGGIFISYRRGDTSPYAGRLSDTLVNRFGPDSIFRDIDGIAPGERACIQVKGDFKRIVGKGSGAAVSRKLEMPSGRQTRVALVKVIDQSARTSVRVTD